MIREIKNLATGGGGRKQTALQSEQWNMIPNMPWLTHQGSNCVHAYTCNTEEAESRSKKRGKLVTNSRNHCQSHGHSC